MSSRVSGALVGLLVAVVLVGTVVMWVDYRHRIDDTAAQAATDPGPQAQTPSPSASATPQPPVTSLWIGDGYTAGSGADRPESGESCVAARRLGWTCELAAERGTGFLSDGHVFDPAYESLPDRLDQLPAAEPDVVVIDAGRNDLGVFARPAIIAAMGEYVKSLRTTYPDATLVQVVPWTFAQAAPDEELTAAVTDVMHQYGGYVVDPVADGWAGAGKTDLPSLRAANGVANQAGHDLIGKKLAASLRALDLPVPAQKQK